MSRWGRGRSAEPGAGGVPELPEEHRFAIAVDAEAPELVLALRAHPRNRWTEAAIVRGTPPGAPDRAVDGSWVVVRSPAEGRRQAIEEVVWIAQDLGLRPIAFHPLDTVEQPPAGWLEDLLAPWSAQRAHDPTALPPRPLASLAGAGAATVLWRRLRDPSVSGQVRHAAATLVGQAVANTDGLELPDQIAGLLRDQLLRDPDAATLAAAVLEGLRLPARLAALGLRDPLPGLAWGDLLAHREPLIVRAASRLLADAALPPSPTLAARLREFALDPDQDVDVRVAALGALSPPHPDEGLLPAVAELARSHEGALRRAAVRLLVSHLGDAADPGWRVLAPSTQRADLAAIEEILWRHGGERDVPDAAQVAQRMLRRRLLDDGHPPTGARLLSFLARHRGRIDVDSVLVEVEARWERLPRDVRAHLIVLDLVHR